MIEKKRGAVNNGRIVNLELPDFSGEARLIDRGGLAYVSYRIAGRRPANLDRTVTIDGEQWSIAEDTMSERNPGFRTLALRRVG